MRTLLTFSITLLTATMLLLTTVSAAQQVLEPASLTIIPAQLAKPAVQRPAPDVLALPYLNPDGTVAAARVMPMPLEAQAPAPEINLGQRRLTPLSESLPATYLRGHPKFVPLPRLP